MVTSVHFNSIILCDAVIDVYFRFVLNVIKGDYIFDMAMHRNHLKSQIDDEVDEREGERVCFVPYLV